MHQFKGSSTRYIKLRTKKCNKKRTKYKVGIMKNILFSLSEYFCHNGCSIGAKKVKVECTQFREYCKTGNGEG
jgi:hypothetical protein